MSLFGTDGIRGKAFEAPLDRPTVQRLAQAIGETLLNDAQTTVLLGHDGRFSADMIGEALMAGFASREFSCIDAGLITTPALAHETRLGGHSLGIMISASHNPAEDNGIKIFAADGSKITDQVETRIETAMAKSKALVVDDGLDFVRRSLPATVAYENFLKKEAFAGLALGGTRILLDCANGAGSKLAPKILEDFGACVLRRNWNPDGRNINKNCGALHPERIAKDVIAEDCHLACCLDGDGDRAVFIDEKGNVVHGDAILAALALDFAARGRLAHKKVAVTVMSNLGLKSLLSEHGVELVETPVGDRAVVAAMREHGLNLGGEPSGHLIFGSVHNYTGDGIYSCLELLQVLVESKKTLSELTDAFHAYPQILINVPCRPEKPKLSTLPELQDAQARIEERLGENGRVVLRYSGTENLCRVMLEGPEESLVNELCRDLASVVQAAIGAESR